MYPQAPGRLRATAALLAAATLIASACANGADAAAPTTTPQTMATTTTLPPPPPERAWLRSRDPVFRGLGHQSIAAVALGGPGLVAVGVDSSGDDADAAVWLSSDGEAWTRVESPALGGAGAQGMEELVIAPAGIVAVGWDSSGGDVDAAAWFSVDGVTWEKAGGDAFRNEGHEEARTVLAAGDGFIAAGFAVIGREADAAVWMSPDGRKWSRSDDPALAEPGTQRISSLTLGPHGLIAGGTNFIPNELGVYALDARLWTSSDGSSWTAVDHPAFSGEGWQYITSVVATPGGLVAAGGDILGAPGQDNDAAVWISPDGLDWERVDDPDFTRDRAQQISAITLGPDGLIAVGYDTALSGDRLPAVWNSTDGRAWVRVDGPGLSEPGHSWMSDVIAGDLGKVAVGSDGARSVGDPAVWVSGVLESTT